MRAFFSWDSFDGDGWRSEPERGPDGEPLTALYGPQRATPAPFTAVVPSWSAETPDGSQIEVQLRARRDGRWTRFYRIARWDSLPDPSARTSFDAQSDEDGRVATDTLVLAGPADAIQPRVLLRAADGARQPRLRELHLALSGPGAPAAAPARLPVCDLAVPPRSQMIYPDGGNVWCSPTSVTMLLAYWHAQTGDERLAPYAELRAVPELAVPLVYDPAYDGHGNWAFNTAFAASHGLRAYVTRLAGLGQLALWVAAGVPVIISVAWQSGGLRNAPIDSSDGHLLVVTGFDEQGQVIVADPASPDERGVRRRYDAAQLEAAWQAASQGAVYLIYPPTWPTPAPDGAPWC